MSLRTLLRNRILFSLLALVAAAFVLLLLTDHHRRTSSARSLLGNWQLVEAERALRSLVEDDPSSLELRRVYAECLFKQGELRKARDEYATLAALDSTDIPSHVLFLAFVHFYLGNMDTSTALASQILNLPDSSQKARALNLLGRVAFNEAHYDSAMVFQRLSFALARLKGNLQIEADALRQIGVLYWYLGKADSARMAFYEPALRIYKRLNDRIGEATTLNNIALAGGPMNGYLEAFAIRKEIGDQIGLADSYYFVTSGGLSHWFDLMYSLRKKSYDLSKRIGYKWGEEVAARAVEDMLVMAHDSVRFDPLVIDSTSMSTGEQMIHRVLRKSSALARDGNWKGAALLREEAVAMCDSMGYAQGLGQALALQVVALLPLGELRRAEAVAQRLVTVWTKLPIEAGCTLARVHLAAGRTHRAAGLLDSLIKRLDSEYFLKLRQNDITLPLISANFLTLRYELFSLLIKALSRDKDAGKIFATLERFRALPVGFASVMGNGDETIWHAYASTLEVIEKGSEDIDNLVSEFTEAYRNAEAQHVVASSASERLYGKPLPDLQDVQCAMGGNQVLLEYFVGKEEAYVIVLRRDRSLFLKLSQTATDINSSIRAFRDLLLRGRTSPEDGLWKGPASFLFRILVQPLIERKFLKDGDHLIISPQGKLHEVPFACLLAPDGSLLIQGFTLSYLPSASHILEGSKETESLNFLGLVPDKTSLPFSEIEVDSIPKALFSSETILRDDQATSSSLVNRAGASSIIHIAAHGSMHRWHPLFSHLQLSDGPLELHSILNIRLSSRLVVLSACETGYGVGMMGDIAAGHEVVSFPEAFLSAGASVVIAPLWIVEDQATSRLMASFYSHLASIKQSGTPLLPGTFARALALAQQRFAGDPEQYPGKNHPFYWAGFYLMGNPN